MKFHYHIIPSRTHIFKDNHIQTMMKLALPEKYSGNLSSNPVTLFSGECWFDDDASILDVDYFVKTLTGIKAKGVRPDLIGSIITHYASKWLPELSSNLPVQENALTNNHQTSPTSSGIKKRFLLETLVGILPPEKDSVPCNFLLRLLKYANMVGVESSFREELEKRISRQLEQASLMELLIPSFSHTFGSLLDVELVVRLVKGFVESDEGVGSEAAMIKVAKLVDCYLAEAALDLNLTSSEFLALARALPAQARAMDDGLYRAIDTYLKTHPDISKEERKAVCKLIDCQKLSVEASLHAVQNERLPVRSMIQVLLSEQSKLSCQIDWSRSFSTARSPNIGLDQSLESGGHSKRQMTAPQMEIKKVKEDVLKLHSQCFTMQGQIDKLLEKEKKKKKKKKWFFSWKKFSITSFTPTSVVVADKIEGSREMKSGDSSIGRQTPVDRKTKMVGGKSQARSRKSMS